VIVLSYTRHPYAFVSVPVPAPARFAAANDSTDAVVCDPAVVTEYVFDAKGRPPAAQIPAPVTSLPVTHCPVLYPVDPTAADASGDGVLLNNATFTVSADRPFAPYVVGSVVDHTLAVSGFRTAWMNTRDVGELSVQPAIA
jgi:hypothetical protein